MIHRLSFFRHAFDAVPTCVGYTWPDFVAQLLPHEFRPDEPKTCPRCKGDGCRPCKNTGEVPAKIACPAWSPAFYPEHARRGAKNAECASVFAADLDGLYDDDLERFTDLAVSLGWAFLLVSTWSNGNPDKPGHNMRAAFPLSREVTPDEWPVVWHAVNDALGSMSDPKCKDISRLYFGAYAPLGTEQHAFSHVWEGNHIDVDALLSGAPIPPTPAKNTAPAARPEDTQKETVSRERLQRFARTLGRKHDDRSSELGATLMKVCNGESFAASGARDTTIYRLSLTIARRFTDCDANSIAEHFRQSLGLMGREADDCPTVDDVAYKIDRAQTELLTEQAATEATELAMAQQRIRDAFGTDRDTPYTLAEITSFGKPRWIIQKAKSYYNFVNGDYRGPYTQDEAMNAAIRDLAPANTAGVEMFAMTAQGERVAKTLNRLVRDYGFIADDVAVSLSAQLSYFDEKTRTIVEAPCVLRDIEPAYDAQVNTWLEHLAGPERAPLLKAWVANLTRLDVPCTALFLTGAKGTGKNLGPEGWSRLWTTLGTPTPLEDVLGTNFNDQQLRCPLTFADERLPTDHRGRVLNAELRHYIQARIRPLRRKFMSNATMIGCTRLVISANNEEILSTTENLSNHDIGAITERYLWVPCQTEAAAYLKTVDHSNWVGGDVLAAHALWLRDNYAWKSNGRFLVHSQDEELHSRLASSSGIRSSVLQFCVGYLLNPERLDNDPRGRFLIRVSDARLCVNAQALVSCWDTYVSNEKCPNTGRLANAIGALADSSRVRLSLPNGKRPNYRVITAEHLKSWSVRTGFADEEQIDEALSTDTEDRAKHLLTVVKDETA